MDVKICTRCGETKAKNEFFKSGLYPNGKSKYRGDCKYCSQLDTYAWREKNRSEYNNYTAEWRAKNPDRQHATDIKRYYGLSREDYDSMLAKQNYQCAICGKLHDSTIKRGRLYVDHCHDSKKIRGLLCSGCNTALGHFDDDIETLRKAISYLKS